MKKKSTTTSRTGRRVARALGTAAAAGALAWLAVTGGPTVASAGAGNARPVAEEAPGFAVEDHAYPDADRILAEQGITLKRGDGHILLADCASGTGLMEVWSRDKQRVCFRTTGSGGWLTLEIPSVYLVKAADYATEVDMTVGTEEKSFDVPANSWQSVGEAADPEVRPHVLVEIRTTK